MTKFVFDFTEGDKDQKDLLGGKGANLAEMTKLGLPVPPGFTITTEACREYLSRGAMAFHFPDCPTCAEGPHNLCDPDEDEPDFSGDREHHDGADRPDKRHHAGDHSEDPDEHVPAPLGQCWNIDRQCGRRDTLEYESNACLLYTSPSPRDRG